MPCQSRRRLRSVIADLLKPLRRLCGGSVAGASEKRVEFASTVKYETNESPEIECPVCLSTFVDGEEISELNDCKHLFHRKCIDKWLREHSTCPLCRNDLPVRRRRRPPPEINDRFGFPDRLRLHNVFI